MNWQDLSKSPFKHHASHGDGSCPVCGQGTLDASWQEQTIDLISSLRERAVAATKAQKELRDARGRAQRVARAVPDELRAPARTGLKLRRQLASGENGQPSPPKPTTQPWPRVSTASCQISSKLLSDTQEP